MKFEVLTLFPEMFAGVVGTSILKRAQAAGLVSVNVRNIRDYAIDKHRVTDDAPYGGGPGMVMKPEPIAAAIEAATAENPELPVVRVYLSPQGETWNQELAREFAQLPGVVLLCGHYEGIDERARELYIDREISIGDYVLTGGEIPAMVIIDSVIRLLPGVLGNEESAAQESFNDGVFDHPHYTRPEVFQGRKVPEVLLSGHHKKIEEWRRLQALERTMARRPDLLERSQDSLSPQERALIQSLLRDRD
jgi:tRNA (guanine37-N1)-methyltransferase